MSLKSAVSFLLVLFFMAFVFYVTKPANQILNDKIISELAQSRTVDSDIVIVTIDDYSLWKLQDEWGKWPWNRSIHAFLLEEMERAQAKVIAYDIIFSQPDNQNPDGDAYFNEVISQFDNLIFAASKLDAKTEGVVNQGFPIAELPETSGFIPLSLSGSNAKQAGGVVNNNDITDHKKNKNRMVLLDLPWAIDTEHWSLGAVNYHVDADGIGRKYAWYQEFDGYLWPNFSTAIFKKLNPNVNPQSYSRYTNKVLSQNIKSIINWVALDSEGEVYAEYSYQQLYQWFEAGNEQAFLDAFKDKIVLMGVSASGLFDLRHTPLSAQHAGTIIQANALDNMLNNGFYQPVSDIRLLIISILVFLLCQRFTLRLSFSYQAILAFLTLLITAFSFFAISYWLALDFNYLLPIVSSLSALTASLLFLLIARGWQAYQQNLKTVDRFSRFMQPEVVKMLIKENKLDPQEMTRKCEVTVLFSDIRGFTTISERKTAEQVIELLNAYFATQLTQVFKHHGTFDKFIGDAVMAFWGAPIEDKHHALNAVNCALDMITALNEFIEALPEEDKGFDIGIGLHSGEAVVGMLGSEQRYDYTAIGDTVNVASRIEGQTKGRARLLISSSTQLSLERCIKNDQLASRFDYKSHGFIQLKGRDETAELFEVMDMNNKER